MSRFLILILSLSLSVNKVFAEDNDSDKTGKIYANVGYSLFNVPLPGAFNFDGYYAVSNQWMFGFDYSSASYGISILGIDIGEIKEKKYTLLAKRFYGRNFNMIMGVGQREIETRFGVTLLDLITNNYSETWSTVETKYIRLGLGHQWQFENRYTLTVDWLSIDIPISGNVKKSAVDYGATEEDKDSISYGEDILKYFPGGSMLKFSVGLQF